MSKTVDQRVVEMRFDNKQFESGVSTTMSTLEKFKKSLDLKGAAKGLDEVSAAAKKCDVGSVGVAAEKVGLKFNAMYTMADQALRNITNSAMAAGKRIVSALTIDPIKTGFSEYETQINAIQTILANTESKGTTLDDVNGALDELNTYADKTIYNFTEMTRNIGTFTAAGVDLDTSVQAIKGIANLAAVSGSTSQQASTAMYQLSQAMASGTVKLMDWNSVVNAGMGGQVFQDALKETARVHGIAIDDIISKQGSFRESLSEGWLTTEILTDTLAKFTGDLSEEQLKSQGYTEKQIEEIMKLGKTANDAATKVKTFTQLFDTLKEAAQSGWTQTWEILVGDFEEAKELLTQISDAVGGFIGKSAEARNELLENWKVMGGREDLIESFKNIFEGLVSVITPIKDAFREIFPPTTAEQLVAITKGLKEFTSKLKLSDKGAENLKRTFRGLFAVVGLVGDIFKAAFKAIKIVFGGVDELGGGILGVTAVIGDFLMMFVEAIRYGNVFEKVFTVVGRVIKFVVQVIANLVKGIGSIFEFAAEGLVFPGFVALVEFLKGVFDGMSDVGDSAESMRDRVSNALSAMGDALRNNPIFKFFSTIWQGIKNVGSAIAKVFKNVFGGIFDIFANGSITDIIEFINGIISGGIGVAIFKFISNLGGSIKTFKELTGSIDDILGAIGGSFEAFQNSLNAEALKKIAVAIAILTASVLVLSLIDNKKLTDSVAAIGMLFAGLMGSMAVMGKSTGTVGLAGAASTMVALSTGILLMSFALKSLAKLDIKQMSTGLLGVAGLMGVLVASMKILSIGKKTVVEGAMQMVIVAAAAKMLSKVLIDISVLNWEELGIGVIGLTAVMALLVGAMKILPLGTNNIARPFFKFCAQIVIVAKAAQILANALIDIAYLEWGELAVGLTGLTGVMVLLVGAMKVLGTIAGTSSTTGLKGDAMMSTTKSINGIALAMIALAASVRIIVPAVEQLGSLSWGELGKAGVAFAGLLAALAIFSLELKMIDENKIKKTATSLLIISSSLLILAASLKIFGGMSWESLGKAGAVLAAIVGVIALLALESKLANPGVINAMAASLLIFAVALGALLPPLLAFSLMSWGMLAKAGVVLGGLVVVLAALGAASKLVRPGSLAVLASSLIILSVGLQMLVIPLALIGNMKWQTIVTGLLTIAGAFAILGVAGKLLTGLAPVILTLCASMALLGVAALAFGAGLVMIGAGLASIGASLVVFGAGLSTLIVSLVQVIPLAIQKLAEGIGQAIVAICRIITDGAPAIGEAAIALVLMLCDVLIECLPAIVDTALQLIIALLDSLTEMLPQITDSLFELLLGVIESLTKYVPSLVSALFDIIVMLLDGIADNIPVLIQSVVDIFVAIFQGAIDALSSIDSGVLVEGALAVGLIAIVMKALAGVAALVPQAMIGVLGVGAIIAELAIVLAAIGALAQIPGLTWLINEGGNLLEAVGTAIGKLIGGIVGGIAQGFTSSLPEIGNDLSNFMSNVKPFIEGAKEIDQSVVSGVTSLVGAMLAITGANFIESISTLFTGRSSMSMFATELPKLGEGLKGFSDSVAGVNPENITAASNAAKALADMTSAIPNEGGMVSWFAGDNSISKFANELPTLGEGLKGFSDSVSGIVPENITAAANAAKSLTEMTSMIPNSGGVVSWFAGDNSISKFANELPTLGEGLKGFSDSVMGIVPENIIAATTAAKTLVELTNNIPNSGGVVSWFAGDNSISKFSEDLVLLGKGLSGFSTALVGVNPETITAAANAAKSLVNLTNNIPNSGGVVSWFAGDNSVSKFANELVALGRGLKGFSDATIGVNPETMTAAANAGKALAEMTSYIPKEGGVVSWFAGETSISKFSLELVSLGKGLKGFSDATAGINPETMVAAANSAASIAKLTEAIPTEGGIKAWFSGESSIASFSDKLPKLGAGLKGFSESTSGINPETTTAAAYAAKSLAEMTQHIPKEGGIKAWFSGESSIANFADKLPTLGKALQGFSKSVAGINPENVTAAASAAKSLAQMTETVPAETDKIVTFGDNLAKFGTKLSEYFKNTKGVTTESTTASTNAINAIKAITTVDTGKINDVSTSIDKVGKAIKDLSKIPGDTLSSFTKSLGNLGKKSVKAFTEEFDDLDSDLKKAAKKGVDGFIEGVNDKKSKAKKAFTKLAEECSEAVSDKKKSFVSAGKALAQGLADGISANSYKAEAKAKAMAEAAAEAARKALDINSPSKVFRALGYSMPEGMAIGIERLGYLVTDSVKAMTSDSIKSVKNSISRISEIINSDMDTQPTIRPVLDLSDVKSGANSISKMFNAPASVGVMANVGAISSAMKQRNQNGTNDDVVSAIEKLSKHIRNNKGDTYNVGNISYDDDSSIADAVRELVRAAKVERRK